MFLRITANVWFDGAELKAGEFVTVPDAAGVELLRLHPETFAVEELPVVEGEGEGEGEGGIDEEAPEVLVSNRMLRKARKR